MTQRMRLKMTELKPLIRSVMIMTVFIIACKVMSYKIMFQITPSLPRGAYWIDKPEKITTGMLCVFPIPPDVYGMMKSREWLPEHVDFYLMKPVVAQQGDVVEVSARGLYINNRYFGPVYHSDSQGLPLPKVYRRYLLGPGEYFVATAYSKSFDSRYFGKIRRADIRWVARPLLVMG